MSVSLCGNSLLNICKVLCPAVSIDRNQRWKTVLGTFYPAIWRKYQEHWDSCTGFVNITAWHGWTTLTAFPRTQLWKPCLQYTSGVVPVLAFKQILWSMTAHQSHCRKVTQNHTLSQAMSHKNIVLLVFLFFCFFFQFWVGAGIFVFVGFFNQAEFKDEI